MGDERLARGDGSIREVVVAFAGLSTSREAQERIARSMGFPDYYGCNLSALWDCLTDVCRPTRLVLDLSGVSSPDLESYLRRLAAVALRAAEDTPSLEVRVQGL